MRCKSWLSRPNNFDEYMTSHFLSIETLHMVSAHVTLTMSFSSIKKFRAVCWPSACATQFDEWPSARNFDVVESLRESGWTSSL